MGQNLSFLIIRATAYTLLAFNISFYKFYLVWSAEISKSQIFTFWFSKKTCRGHLVTKGMVTHVFSNFQVPRNIPEKKIMQKNLILHFFVMSAFEMEKIKTSLILVFIPSSLVLSMFSQF